MNRPVLLPQLFPSVLTLAALLGTLTPESHGFQVREKISEFGRYEGFAEKQFNSYVRTSLYLEMRDGIQLAADIMRPALDGKVTEQALPCVWTHTRYRRATRGANGRIQCAADSPTSFPLIEHGYNLVVVDVRGSGASFGAWEGIFTEEETQDSFEITEWIAEQSWCDGNIGMTGGSYLGITQLMAASKKPSSLKALFPIVALFDFYDTAYHGGIYFDDFLGTWSQLTKQLDTQSIAVGVDEDPHGRLLMDAIEDHQENRALVDILEPLKFRDSRDDFTGALPYRDWHPAGFLEEISDSKIPIYLWCGWFDAFTRDGFLMHRSFENPRKIAMGAWSHSPRDPRVARLMFNFSVIEQLRWFDYWLKGIDNGVMDEPPIAYHTMAHPDQEEWRFADSWPLPESQLTPYYFSEGPSGSVDSINDGLLRQSEPVQDSPEVNPEVNPEEGNDTYIVDYTTTSGTTSRWDNTVGGGFGYPDMTANDQRALTYTSSLLKEDLEITGHPQVHLWISSSATDSDFFVFLEEVDGSGHSHYVSEGTIRASMRALHQPENPKIEFLPWHRCNEEDQQDLVPGEIVELVIDLQPTSTIFNKSHRMRVTVCCADADNAQTPKLSPAPTVHLYRNASHPSRILLPVVRSEGR